MCRDDGGGIDAFIRNAPCAFNYIIYPIFVQCYVMGRFGHENGPFWMLAGAVLVLFFLPLGPFWSGPFWFAWTVFDLHWGRFGDGSFWSVPASTTYVSGAIASVQTFTFTFTFAWVCMMTTDFDGLQSAGACVDRSSCDELPVSKQI